MLGFSFFSTSLTLCICRETTHGWIQGRGEAGPGPSFPRHNISKWRQNLGSLLWSTKIMKICYHICLGPPFLNVWIRANNVKNESTIDIPTGIKNNCCFAHLVWKRWFNQSSRNIFLVLQYKQNAYVHMFFNDESALKLQIPLPHRNLLVNSIDLYVQIFTLPVFSATMNIRKILTSIFPWRNVRDVWAGCSGGCSEYHPVVYSKTDIS